MAVPVAAEETVAMATRVSHNLLCDSDEDVSEMKPGCVDSVATPLELPLHFISNK